MAEISAFPAPLQRNAGTGIIVSGHASAGTGDSWCHHICGKAAQISRGDAGSSFLPACRRQVELWTPPHWAICLCLGPSCAVTAGYTGHSPPRGSAPCWAQAGAGRALCWGTCSPREQPTAAPQQPLAWLLPSHLPLGGDRNPPQCSCGTGLGGGGRVFAAGVRRSWASWRKELPPPSSCPLALLKQRWGVFGSLAIRSAALAAQRAVSLPRGIGAWG